jgi:hypothetical protein
MKLINSLVTVAVLATVFVGLTAAALQGSKSAVDARREAATVRPEWFETYHTYGDPVTGKGSAVTTTALDTKHLTRNSDGTVTATVRTSYSDGNSALNHSDNPADLVYSVIAVYRLKCDGPVQYKYESIAFYSDDGRKVREETNYHDPFSVLWNGNNETLPIACGIATGA